jgi:hypothetical protein
VGSGVMTRRATAGEGGGEGARVIGACARGEVGEKPVELRETIGLRVVGAFAKRSSLACSRSDDGTNLIVGVVGEVASA